MLQKMESVQTSQNMEKNRKNEQRQNKNILQDIANVQKNLAKTTDSNIQKINIDKGPKDLLTTQKLICDKDTNVKNSLAKITDKDTDNIQKIKDLADIEKTIEKNPNIFTSNDDKFSKDGTVDNDGCICDDLVMLEDPNDPRGCIYFQVSTIGN